GVLSWSGADRHGPRPWRGATGAGGAVDWEGAVAAGDFAVSRRQGGRQGDEQRAVAAAGRGRGAGVWTARQPAARDRTGGGRRRVAADGARRRAAAGVRGLVLDCGAGQVSSWT